MIKTFVFNRYDVAHSSGFDDLDVMVSGDGMYVRAQDALDREAVNADRIRVLELQLKEARAPRLHHLIIAEFHRDAKFYAQRVGWSPHETRFVDREEHLQGHRGDVLWVHATAWRRKDIHRILETARAHEMRGVPVDDFLP
jgi:hypothetical protein